MKHFLAMICAVLSLAMAAPFAHGQNYPQYTEQFIGNLNWDTVNPCGWPNGQSPTAQMQGALGNLQFYGGGVLDLTCYVTNITVTADVFSPISAPVTLILSPHTITVNANATIPSNFTIICYAGGSIVAGGGYTLTNNAASICTGGGGGAPGGSNTDVQFNNSGAFGGNNDFVYLNNGGIWRVGIGTASPQAALDVQNGIISRPQGTQSIGSVSFSGGGLNDMTNSGAYTCLGSDTFNIMIIATGTPDQFFWGDMGTSPNPVAITGSPQLLNCGVYVTFAATTGHTIDDTWSFTSTATQTLPPLQTYGLANNLALTLGSDSSIIAGNIFTDNNVLQTSSVSLGQGAMYYGQGTVVEDTAIGFDALFADLGGNNTAVGAFSIAYNETGSQNTGIGSNTLYSLEGGNGNVAIGYNSGFSEMNGNENIFLGFAAGFGETGSNQLYIDNANLSTPFIHGDMSALTLAINSSLTLNAANDVSGQTMMTITGDAQGDDAADFINYGTNDYGALYAESDGTSAGRQPTAGNFSSNYDDSGGSGNVAIGIIVNSDLTGTNGAGDYSIGVTSAAENIGTGDASELVAFDGTIYNLGEAAAAYAFRAESPSIGTIDTTAAAFDTAAGWPVDILIDTTQTVAGLPSAATYVGGMKGVSNSTAIMAEGQTCVDAGGGGGPALAWSNGTIWKCF